MQTYLRDTFDGKKIAVDVYVYIEEGSRCSNSDHYAPAEFSLETVYLVDANDNHVDITDRLKDKKLQEIEEFFCENFYDGKYD